MGLSIRKFVNALLKPVGYHISRLSQPAVERVELAVAPTVAERSMTALESALTRVVGRGMEVNTIIDVGASNGQWTQVVQPFFPKANCLLVEANPLHEKSLRQFKQKFAYADYVLAAAGDTTGEIYFDASDPLGGLASHTPLSVPTITVPVTTIDTLVKQHGLRPPFLIKLDTHGFEVPILKGAEQALEQTNLLIVETYNFKLTSTSLKFHEICQLIGTWGFSPIDFCDPLWRARDNAFWQFDIFFVRDDRNEFKYNKYA